MVRNQKWQVVTDNLTFLWHHFRNFSETLEGILKNFFGLKILTRKFVSFRRKSMMKILWSKFCVRKKRLLTNASFLIQIIVVSSFWKMAYKSRPGIIVFFKISFHFRWIFIFKNFGRKGVPWNLWWNFRSQIYNFRRKMAKKWRDC